MRGVVRRQRADVQERVLMTPASKSQLYMSIIVPADGTRAANVGTGDFGRSPIFVQLSDKPRLPVSDHMVPERKIQWRVENLRADRIR